MFGFWFVFFFFNRCEFLQSKKSSEEIKKHIETYPGFAGVVVILYFNLPLSWNTCQGRTIWDMKIGKEGLDSDFHPLSPKTKINKYSRIIAHVINSRHSR